MDRLAWVLTKCTQNRLEAWKFRSAMGCCRGCTLPENFLTQKKAPSSNSHNIERLPLGVEVACPTGAIEEISAKPVQASVTPSIGWGLSFPSLSNEAQGLSPLHCRWSAGMWSFGGAPTAVTADSGTR